MTVFCLKNAKSINKELLDSSSSSYAAPPKKQTIRKQKTERLTEEAFQKFIQSLPLGERTKIIAYGVLVEGRRQIELSREFGISKSAVSQSVHRVVSAYKNVIPEGFERISVVLPSSLIPQVLEWEKEANLSKKLPFSKKRTTK